MTNTKKTVSHNFKDRTAHAVGFINHIVTTMLNRRAFNARQIVIVGMVADLLDYLDGKLGDEQLLTSINYFREFYNRAVLRLSASPTPFVLRSLVNPVMAQRKVDILVGHLETAGSTIEQQKHKIAFYEANLTAAELTIEVLSVKLAAMEAAAATVAAQSEPETCYRCGTVLDGDYCPRCAAADRWAQEADRLNRQISRLEDDKQQLEYRLSDAERKADRLESDLSTAKSQVNDLEYRLRDAERYSSSRWS